MSSVSSPRSGVRCAPCLQRLGLSGAGYVTSPSWLSDGDLAYLRVDTLARTAALVRRAWETNAPAQLIVRWLTGHSPVAVRWNANGVGTVVQRGWGDTLMLARITLAHPTQVEDMGIRWTDAYTADAAISRDGALIAYQTNVEGREDVYVQRITGGKRMLVTPNGGCSPVWAGPNELLFIGGGNRRGRGRGAGRANSCLVDSVRSVRLQTSPDLSSDAPTVMWPAETGMMDGTTTFLVPLPGDSTFLFAARGDGRGGRGDALPMVVLTNAHKEIERLFRPR